MKKWRVVAAGVREEGSYQPLTLYSHNHKDKVKRWAKRHTEIYSQFKLAILKRSKT